MPFIDGEIKYGAIKEKVTFSRQLHETDKNLSTKCFQIMNDLKSHCAMRIVPKVSELDFSISD